MNASVEWLSAFVDSGLSPTALRDLLTARVATVDEVVPLGADLAGLVVGRVVDAGRHPDSDHLWVVTVDAGGPEPVVVVCGAPNVSVGGRYPFAPVGMTMPNGLTIERRKIRGQPSSGMLCSARELGLGEEHEGILPLDPHAVPGTPVARLLPPGDTRLVIDVGTNRPDLLSHQGIAREIAAATGRPLREPEIPGARQAPAAVPSARRVDRTGATGGVRVTVESSADCPAYLGVVIRGVRVGPSPAWLVARLAAVGVRSINNVVDVTNYMLHGYGQPMHAFDLARLAGGEVRVRRARAGERLISLDGVQRTLDETMAVIADAHGAQAVAGVIGGKGSEVSAATTDLFLEVASFDPRRVRAARRALGVTTDASYRFERVVPVASPVETHATAVRLLLALAGGQLAGAPVLVAAPPSAPALLLLRTRRVAQVLGVPVPARECAALLTSIGIQASTRGEDVVVNPPTWRPDITAEINLVEEVARLRGYETFPDELRPYRPGTVPDDPLVGRGHRLRELLVGRGFLEMRPMPFVPPSTGGEPRVRVLNPLADGEAYLRSDLMTSLARRAEHNLAHMEGDLRLFEIGTVFRGGAGRSEGRPAEEVRVAALCMGARRPPHFTEPSPPPWDEWDVKALGESLAETARPGEPVELRPDGQADVLWRVYVGGVEAGRVARVPLDAPRWATPAFGVEVTLAATDSADVAPPGHHASEPAAAPAAPGAGGPKYRRPPAFPPMRIDITFDVPETVPVAAVERVLRRTGESLLDRLELLSEFHGQGVQTGHRSLTWRLTFRHSERTLREKEVEATRDKLLRALETELGVRQRSS
jgi:phenylalanyl-tRNA synthetase beta chain